MVWHVINVVHNNILLSCRVLIASFIICTIQFKFDLPGQCHWYFSILSSPGTVSCLLFLLCFLLYAHFLQGQAEYAPSNRSWTLHCLWNIFIIFLGYSSWYAQEEKMSLEKAQKVLLHWCHFPDAECMANRYSLCSHSSLVRISRYRYDDIYDDIRYRYWYVLDISNLNVGSAMCYWRVCLMD